MMRFCAQYDDGDFDTNARHKNRFFVFYFEGGRGLSASDIIIIVVFGTSGWSNGEKNLFTVKFAVNIASSLLYSAGTQGRRRNIAEETTRTSSAKTDVFRQWFFTILTRLYVCK